MPDSGLVVHEIRIRNFRCLRSVDLVLGRKTLLVGENNAGKTSFLQALSAAVGSGAHTMSSDDVFLAPNETRAPKHRRIIVDVLLRPANSEGNQLSEFPSDGPWLAHFGEGVSQDAQGNDQVALRAELFWDNERGEYTNARHFLSEWPTDSSSIESAQATIGEPLSRRHIEPLELSYIDANRDIAREFRTGGSYWRKLVADLGVSEELLAQMEEDLSKLNEKLVTGSEVLSHLKQHLNDLYKTLASGNHSVDIASVPRHIQDLSRGVEALVSTQGGPSFPLEAQGMGTRSLAALLTFRAFVEWKAKRSSHIALHPFVAIEEPEAHLQPQAQRAVFTHLEQLPGQWLATTHSPYVCSQADLRDCRVFFKANGESSVRRFEIHEDPQGNWQEELRMLRRHVMNTRGDMLFSRVLVLFEGETEEQCIPRFAERYFEAHPSMFGLSMIGVGGCGNYRSFIHLAKTFGIPWRVLSDGEPNAVAALDLALTKLGEEAASSNSRVTILPNDWCFEQYIAAEGRHEPLIAMLIEHDATGDQHREALRREWDAHIDPCGKVASRLMSSKTKFGSLVADALREVPIPLKISAILDGVRQDLRQ